MPKTQANKKIETEPAKEKAKTSQEIKKEKNKKCWVNWDELEENIPIPSECIHFELRITLQLDWLGDWSSRLHPILIESTLHPILGLSLTNCPITSEVSRLTVTPPRPSPVTAEAAIIEALHFEATAADSLALVLVVLPLLSPSSPASPFNIPPERLDSCTFSANLFNDGLPRGLRAGGSTVVSVYDFHWPQEESQLLLLIHTTDV
ncbi:unnamed protein product [Rodentolepis nana]|uniref:Uncharacterized protein n=1 Tax=Rodentolepis nana TaxID=102285 RepID=A0A0R3TYP5_RODNA|nr:unnamed protein product [Rodentolepis nana]